MIRAVWPLVDRSIWRRQDAAGEVPGSAESGTGCGVPRPSSNCARGPASGLLAALSGFRSPLGGVSLDRGARGVATDGMRSNGRLVRDGDCPSTPSPPSIGIWPHGTWRERDAAALRTPRSPASIAYSQPAPYISGSGGIFFTAASRTIRKAPCFTGACILLRDKLHDHCGAGEAFLKASQLPDAAPYLERFAGYELAQCPGREQVVTKS
jgi:hypothetical protein